MTRVLIVDDEPESRTRLRSLLQAHGHAVTEATNGLDALEHARQQPPDLVISDILMPQMDGFALCRASRTDPALARTPFVFYTGTYASARDVAFARRLGATRFLVKSMAAEEVIRAITESAPPAGCVDTVGGVEPSRTRPSRGACTTSRSSTSWSIVTSNSPTRCGTFARSPPARTLPAHRQPDRHRGRITFVNRRFEEVTGFTRDMVQRADPRHPAYRTTPTLASASRFGPHCWPARNGVASSSSAGRMARSSGNGP